MPVLPASVVELESNSLVPIALPSPVSPDKMPMDTPDPVANSSFTLRVQEGLE